MSVVYGVTKKVGAALRTTHKLALHEPMMLHALLQSGEAPGPSDMRLSRLIPWTPSAKRNVPIIIDSLVLTPPFTHTATNTSYSASRVLLSFITGSLHLCLQVWQPEDALIICERYLDAQANWVDGVAAVDENGNGQPLIMTSDAYQTRSSSRTRSEIVALPPDVVAQIKSSSSITSLNDVIFGLVQNSLDAAADKVAVDVDYSKGDCTVEDTGAGILPSEFAESGALGKAYHTSKYTLSSEHYGSNGLFLSSLAALCLLAITSRHQHHYSTNTLIVHQARPLPRLTPAPISHQFGHRQHGTKVTVRNLFGNMPVRVKHRAMLTRSQNELDKLWDELKHWLTALLIAYPNAVTLRLRDTGGSRRFTLNAASSIVPGENHKQYEIPASQLRTLSLMQQSGKITPVTFDSWIPISAAADGIEIRGIISTEPMPTRNVQFIAIGQQPMLHSDHNAIYDHINRLFARSTFGVVDSTDLAADEDVDRNKPKLRTHSLQKGVDKWPMFVLSIRRKTRQVSPDQMVRDQASFDATLKILDALITSWLSANHFRPPSTRRSIRRPQTVESLSTHAKSEISSKMLEPKISRIAVEPANATTTVRDEVKAVPGRTRYTGVLSMNFLSRVKSARGFTPLGSSENMRPHSCPAISGTKTLGSENATTNGHVSDSSIRVDAISPEWGHASREVKRRKRASDMVAIESLPAANDDQCELNDATMIWVDPATKTKHEINARTGTILPDRSKRDFKARLFQKHQERISFTGTIPTQESNTNTPWLDEVLEQWDNPVFRQQQSGIAQSSFELPMVACSKIQGHQIQNNDMERAFSEVSHLDESKITRDALRNATVIAQVDQKFILAKVIGALDAASLLVMIDQHAADERCKVEELLEDLCMLPAEDDVPFSSQQGLRSLVKTTVLDKSIKFQISREEASLLSTHAAHFAAWGILYDLDTEPAVESTTCHVVVRALPPLIASRCCLDPKLLISLIRAEIWSRHESGKGTTSTSALSGSWMYRISTCPRGLLDMIYSRACRSAIMFNDKLELSQCEDLVKRLAECVLPFQCAHGRPSMVPLLDLGEVGSEEDVIGLTGRSNATLNEPKQDYAAAYRKWQTKA